MEEELEAPSTATCSGGQASTWSTPHFQNANNRDVTIFLESNVYSDIDSTCSTPYVSAPSSPGRGGCGGGGFFYSAPASPMHFLLCSSSANSTPPACEASVSGSFEFDFSARFGTTGSASAAGSMSSADELFLNGQIRPMKLSTHLQPPQVLAPLLDLDETEGDCDDAIDEAEKFPRGRDMKWRDRSLRRRTRSTSPLRSSSFQWHESDDEDRKSQKTQSSLATESLERKQDAAALSESMSVSSSSRSSSASRSSKRWVFLKEFLYRSKSEGRNNGEKFWSAISFSPVKEKKVRTPPAPSLDANASPKETKQTSTVKSEPEGCNAESTKKAKQKSTVKEKKNKAASAAGGGKPSNGVGKRRVPSPSPHELHYKAHRAQAEEMKKKTFLPYRQGLIGCLGFSSKSYGAVNGIARALNSVSSR